MQQKRTVIELVDDLNGDTEATTVRFGLDNKVFEIELGTKNEAKLRRALEPFVEGARVVRPQRRRKSAPKSADVRAWAQENGIEVSPTGRVPQKVIDQYQSSQK